MKALEPMMMMKSRLVHTTDNGKEEESDHQPSLPTMFDGIMEKDDATSGVVW
jgi:hypothetical protein